jgi:hypothetical protein
MRGGGPSSAGNGGLAAVAPGNWGERREERSIDQESGKMYNLRLWGSHSIQIHDKTLNAVVLPAPAEVVGSEARSWPAAESPY